MKKKCVPGIEIAILCGKIPHEIVLSFCALKSTIYSVLCIVYKLYIVYLLISISKTGRICGDMLIFVH
nr:MAG TPA: hypothetical protein [Caudoviricetes sp.]